MARWVMVLCVLSLLHACSSLAAGEDPGGGLTLADAVRIVLGRSPLNRIAEAGVKAAEEGRKSARGAFLPRLRTEFEYTNLSEVPEIPVPADLPPPFSSINFSGGTTNQLHVTTTLEQPLFTGLSLLTRYRLAKLERKAAELKREAVRQELIYRTYQAYFGVLEADKFLEVADQAVSQLEAQAEVARQFYEHGMIPKNDYLKVLVQLADTKRKKIIATQKDDFVKAQFKTLLRWDRNQPVRLKETLAYRPYERSLDECIRIAEQRRPEITLAGLDVEKADQGISLSRSRFFPQISLVGGLTHDEGGFAEMDEVFTATVHADWLIWEWGSNYYEVLQRESRLVQARARKAEKEDEVELEVRKAYLTLQGAKEAIGVAEVGIKQARENYRITEERYRQNMTTSTEVLDAQTLLSQAQVNYYTALTKYNIAIAGLERATGVLAEPVSGG